jgi:excisionase family DNA binding protein
MIWLRHLCVEDAGALPYGLRKHVIMRTSLITTADVADMLSISRTTVYVLINQGRLFPVKIGRRTLFCLSDVEKFISSLQKVDQFEEVK